MKNDHPLHDRVLTANVIVAALGYFVDIFDLLLFGIVRVASLRSLGVPEDRLLEEGVFLLNSQMIGLLIGGILWGVLGDRRGRLSVLFGSILLYSLANIANAFVTNVPLYGALRFIAGIGLAGELGAAITLVSETLSKEKRGYGTTIVAALGILGAVFAAVVGEIFSWQTCYIIGGTMGLLLLGLRVSMHESSLFHRMKGETAGRSQGNPFLLFKSFTRLARYLNCILIGVPIWFVVGILMTFSPELAQALGVSGPVAAGTAIGVGYAGLALGDLMSGFFSQWIKSRKWAIFVFMLLNFGCVSIYLFTRHLTPFQFYGLCALLGFFSGYWAVFITVAAEQFGTNIRATVTTTVPNFVRGSVVPVTLLFQSLQLQMPAPLAALWVGVLVFGIAFIALYFLRETYGRDLNYFEGEKD